MPDHAKRGIVDTVRHKLKGMSLPQQPHPSPQSLPVPLLPADEKREDEGKSTYPPAFTPVQLETLVFHVKDYQITHGSLLKLVRIEQEGTVLARPVGAALFPTLFPRACFEEALALQESLNRLYAAVSEDEEWLEVVLKELIEGDELVGVLWKILKEVGREERAQAVQAGIFRSDYMLHLPELLESTEVGISLEKAKIKQVECNHYHVAGGTHGNIVANMHRHLQRSGQYELRNSLFGVQPSAMPKNDTLNSIITCLSTAYSAYGPIKSPAANGGLCILFIVQPHNFNICDERPIEYGLWDRGIPSFRVLFGEEVLSQTQLTETKELLYTPPGKGWYEVSVVYMRAGIGLAEYHPTGIQARLRLERSRAVKCPSIACHLATLKKVQHALALPGAMERFLPAAEAERLAKTYMPMYVLDESPDGLHARELATGKTAVEYVLKPNLEGGGHNIYRGDIPAYLEITPKERWGQYILMEMIQPPVLGNYLMTAGELYHGNVISELGVFGMCMWRRATEREGLEMLRSVQGGWSFKTKRQDVDEMSVVKGYGCFDSPLLV